MLGLLHSTGSPSMYMLQLIIPLALEVCTCCSFSCARQTLSSTHMQVLLGNPELEGGCVLNKDAARLLKEAPHTYRQMALDCVTASLRIDGEEGGTSTGTFSY